MNNYLISYILITSYYMDPKTKRQNKTAMVEAESEKLAEETLKKYWKYITGGLVGFLLLAAGIAKLIFSRQDTKSADKVTETADKMRADIAEDHIAVVEVIAAETAKEEIVKEEIEDIVAIPDERERVDALADSISAMRRNRWEFQYKNWLIALMT